MLFTAAYAAPSSERGFPRANDLSHLFTRKTGLSMRAYRARVDR